MPASKKKFEFDDAQRRELAALGVVPSQLEALEAVMPRFATMLRPSPRLDDLRGNLEKLEKALGVAAKRLQRFDQFSDDNVAGVAARDLVAATLIRRFGADTLLQTERAIEDLIACVQLARDSLPDEQKRREDAEWGPVQLLDEALTRGWGEAADYPHEPTTTLGSMGSKFAGIAAVCYDAVRRTGGKEPTRAIRSYVGWLAVNRPRGNDSPPENMT